MIFIDRGRVKRPAWFETQNWLDSMSTIRRHVATEASVRAQVRTSTLVGKWRPEIVGALSDLFQNRCGMCESSIADEMQQSVSRFRPLEMTATSAAGGRYPYAYAALMWENLLVICPACQRARGDIFPTTSQPPESELENCYRVAKLPRPRRLYQACQSALNRSRMNDGALQIDPTSEKPHLFVHFDDKGYAIPAQLLTDGSYERARLTIETFALNREIILERRARSIHALQSRLLDRFSPRSLTSGHPTPQDIAKALDELEKHSFFKEYQSCNTFALVRWLRPFLANSLAQTLDMVSLPQPVTAYAKHTLFPIWDQLYGKNDASPINVSTSGHRKVEAPQRKERPSSTNRITQVELTNFRQFKSARFELRKDRPDNVFDTNGALLQELRAAGFDNDSMHPPEPERYVGWQMILGENGVGKSSVLQAIALALLADEEGRPLTEEETKNWCDLRSSLFSDTKMGSIKVQLEDRPQPITLTFTTNKVTLEGNLQHQSDSSSSSREILYLRGYGATRLLPRRGSQPTELNPAIQEIDNLFDPYHPLVDANRWLLSLNPESRHAAFISLHDLLDLPRKKSTSAEGNEMFQGLTFSKESTPQTLGWMSHGHFIPLEHLSAGYQSIIALGCDIMAGFGTEVGDMHHKTGIVLLDEIGTNLHPRWRLRIVQALRRTFPQIQFIATTHEPLCLRGLGEGEVTVLTLDENRQVLQRQLPTPEFYRVDQLLTGDFFGLPSAYDPDEEIAFHAYHSLLELERNLANNGQPMPAEKASLLTRLRDRLKDRLVLGGTPAERRLMDALDQTTLDLAAENNPPGHIEPLKGSPEAQAAATHLRNSLLGKAARQPSTPSTGTAP